MVYDLCGNVDAIFVLSVRTFTQRIRHIEQHFADRGIEFEFIFDFDPVELTSDVLAEYFCESDLSPAHKSLVMKHIQAWRLGIERGCRKILVFEDDAILVKDFGEQIKKLMPHIEKLTPGNLVFLGGSDTKVSDDFFLHDGPLIPQKIATTEAYLCDDESLKRRIRWLQDHKIGLPADHFIKHIDGECTTAHFWLERPLVQQGSLFGMFETHLDGHRKKHNRYYNYLRYYWSKFQRRQLRKWIVRLMHGKWIWR
jgi:glycosyl transferase, family 25